MLFRFKSSHLAGVSIFITTMTVGMTFNPLTIQESQTMTDSAGAGFLAAATAQESDGTIRRIPTKSQQGPRLDSEDDAPTPKPIPDQDFPEEDQEDLNAAALRAANTIAQQSCQGIGQPVTEAEFFQIARRIRPNATEGQIRRAFENFALESLKRDLTRNTGRKKFRSPERARKTAGRPRGVLSNVEPDGIGDVLITEESNNRPPKITRYSDSSFWETKIIKAGKSIGLK